MTPSPIQALSASDGMCMLLRFGAARAPSPDARYGHPVLRSLDADCAPASCLRLSAKTDDSESHTSPERKRRDLHAAAVRSCPCPVAGRSLRPSMASARSMLTALRHPACAGQQRRLSGHGQPLTDSLQHQARRAGSAPAGGGPPSENGRMPCFADIQPTGSPSRIPPRSPRREPGDTGSLGVPGPAWSPCPVYSLT
jgi:hypothetical protein